MRELIEEIIDIQTKINICIHTKDFSNFAALLERYQSLGNRMEAKLSNIKDLKNLREEIKEAAEELNDLKKQIRAKSKD